MKKLAPIPVLKKRTTDIAQCNRIAEYTVVGAGIFLVTLFAAFAIATGEAAATNGASARSVAAPDTYVSYWDGVGNQAFTAAAPADATEGIVIFAYLGIAEYDA